MIRNLLRKQKGTTILELIVATSVAGLLTVTLSAICYTMFIHIESNRAHITAAAGMEKAINYVTNDGQRAQNTNLVSGAAMVDNLTLSWTDPLTGDDYAVLYYLSGSNLQRRESINGVATTEKTVSKHVSSAGFYQPLNETRLFRVSLTSSGGSPRVSEIREYYVLLRAMG
jgi:type II secretory pathway component PulJ